MKLQIFSVYDIKAQIFSRPMYLTHKGEAIRAFQDTVKDQNTMIAKHSEDYKLYKLGTFDETTGKFESLEVPEFMNNATDFVA